MTNIFKTITVFFLTVFFLITSTSPVIAGWVSGYYRSNGTYVNGYYRSDPNGLKYDNYSWSSEDDYYNDSYYDYGRGSNWYTPSWEWQNDYWIGLDSYSSNNDYDGWWSNSYDSNYNDNHDYSYDYNDYNYDYDHDYSYDDYDWWSY